MSLKYRNKNGAETPVAGLNGTSGELVPSVSLYQSGTYTGALPVGYSTNTVIFSEAMPDTDYIVTLSTGGSYGSLLLQVLSKTRSGFVFSALNENAGQLSSPEIKWQAFKLMTNEDRALDEARIEQNTTNFASAFSEVTSYAVGDYVTYDGVLYKCTTAHTAGVWVAGHFTQVTVGGTLNAIVPSDASSSNKLVATENLTNISLGDYQLSVGGDNYAWFDLGTSTSTSNSQAFLFYEITYGRVDGAQSKILVACGGTMADANYIKVVNLNDAQTSASEQFKIDSNKHLWLGMQSYSYARVKVYGRWAGMGSKTTVEPTGTVLPIYKCATTNDLNTYAKPHIYELSGATYSTLQTFFDELMTRLKADAVGNQYGICFMGTWAGKSFFEGSFYTVDGRSSYIKVTFQNPQDSKSLYTGYTGYSDVQVTYTGVA